MPLDAPPDLLARLYRSPHPLTTEAAVALEGALAAAGGGDSTRLDAALASVRACQNRIAVLEGALDEILDSTRAKDCHAIASAVRS